MVFFLIFPGIFLNLYLLSQKKKPMGQYNFNLLNGAIIDFNSRKISLSQKLLVSKKKKM